MNEISAHISVQILPVTTSISSAAGFMRLFQDVHKTNPSTADSVRLLVSPHI
jgi:hypothetical protein